MKKLKIASCFPVMWLSIMLLFTGCETEQSASKNSNAMVGFTQDHAKAQAEFANQDQLEKSSFTETKAVTDGTPQSLNLSK